MHARYCNAECQRNHWATHKKQCKLRAAELHNKSLFKDPPAREDCPICFLPMPARLIYSISLPPATISSVPIYDFAKANVELAKEFMEKYYTCCGKTICTGCAHSCCESGNMNKCPFCNADCGGKSEEEDNKDLMKRAEANDAGAICQLGNCYYKGLLGLPQDLTKAMELYTKAANLGFSQAHGSLGDIYYEGGCLKKAKFHYEAAAMAGHEEARCNLGAMEAHSGNIERALKHLRIAASAGCYNAMNYLRLFFDQGHVSRDSIDSSLIAYNASCAEMRSEARDVYIRYFY